MSLLPLSLSLIVAVGRGEDVPFAMRPIGKAGKIPWHFTEDMRHFKAVTTGHAIIMGRKTFDSIGKALPDRRNIVVTRTVFRSSLNGLTDPPRGTLEYTNSLDNAIAMAREGTRDSSLRTLSDFPPDPEPIIIGGSEIYAAATSWVTRVFLTEVNVEVEDANSWFPMGWLQDFEVVSRRVGETKELTFIELRRKR